MNVTVGGLWVLYIVIIIITLLIGWVVQMNNPKKNITISSTLLIGSIIGAIIVFIGSFWLDINNMSQSDKSWYALLIFIIIIIPFIFLIYISYNKVNKNIEVMNDESIKDKKVIKEEYECENLNEECKECKMTKKEVIESGVVKKYKIKSFN